MVIMVIDRNGVIVDDAVMVMVIGFCCGWQGGPSQG
jgi:hypothetical protein